MRPNLAILFAFSFLSLTTNSQILNNLTDKIKEKTNQPVDNKTDQAIDKTQDQNTASNADSSSPAVIKAYSNYDFVPGDTILFEDNFSDDQDGEFPAHWELKAGQ